MSVRVPGRSPRGVAAVAGALLLAWFAGSAQATAATAADPFYLGLLRDGRTSFARGDAAAAARELRVACFGLLEQTDLLGECLVRLGLAQSAIGDREAFGDTFDRLELVEERFQAYTRAALAEDERRSFENRVVEWVAPEVLRTIPAFAVLAERRAEESLAKLSPRERQKELERRAAADPGSSRWRVLLAEDEAARARWEETFARLKGIPAEAENGRAGCLQGLALAKLDRCREASGLLASCATSANDPRLAEARLGCLLDAKDFDGARSFATMLDPKVASETPVRKLREKIPAPATAPGPRGEPAKTGAEPARQAAAKASEKSKTPTPTPKSPAPKPPAAARAGTDRGAAKLSAEEEKALLDARELLRTAKRRDDLVTGLESLRAASDRHPGNAELALAIGEIAYRSGQWRTGADFFARAASDGPADPTLRFYMAVCLYEAGDRASAAQVAATGLERLQRTPFVEDYLRRIRAAVP